MQATAEDRNERVADAFFSAIESGDLDAVRERYAPDVAVWHNVTGRTQDRESNLALLRAFTGRVGELRYEILDRRHFDGGFVQRHVVHGRLAAGERIEIPVCIVIHVSGDTITAIYEYLDGAAVQPVFA